VIGYRDEPSKSAGQRLLWQTAEDLLPRRDASRFNQALMELGSLVCTPAAPNCEACPVAQLCVARDRGLQDKIPLAAARPLVTAVREAAVIVSKNGALLLRQCAARERWAGLWDFPRFAVENEGPQFARDEITAKVRDQTGVAVDLGGVVTTLKHGVTRFRITLDCYAARPVGGRIRSNSRSPVRWTPARSLAEIPLSATARRISQFVGGEI
jgi:A/G-specific adenine glycosylase